MALVVAGTDFIQMPAGTTAQRPVAPAQGMQRYNTTLAYTEVYTGAAWVAMGNQGATSGITSGTAVASTSGTSIDFTDIPSGVKRITVMLSAVSTNGTSNILVQLGTSSGYETTGYFGATSVNTNGVATTNFTTGFLLTQQTTAASSKHGIIVISNCLNNTWIASINTGESSGAAWTHQGAGSKSLGGVLTQLRITTVNGTDSFDAGSINILYE